MKHAIKSILFEIQKNNCRVAAGKNSPRLKFYPKSARHVECMCLLGLRPASCIRHVDSVKMHFFLLQFGCLVGVLALEMYFGHPQAM